MKHIIKSALVALGVASALGFAATGAHAQANLTAETSSPGNSPHLSTVHLADVLSRDSIANIQVQEGQTATNSIVNIAEGKTDIASVPTVLHFLLEHGRGPFSKIGEEGDAMADKVMALFTYNAGAYGLMSHVSTGIKSYADLKNKTVWNGPPRGAALTVGRQTILLGSSGYEDGKDYKGFQTNWGELPTVLVDGSADAIMVPLTFPSDRVTTALAAGEVNIISMPKEVFESEGVQKFLSAPGNSPIVIKEEDMGYGADQGVHLVSEDGVFRSPGVPFAAMVRADLDKDLVKQMVAAYIKSIPELKQRAPYARNVNFDVVDKVTTGFCGGLTLKYHPGAVEAWKEAGYDIPDCAQ